MSTRCNLIIKSGYSDNSRIVLYHHHDGYPEGVGVQLKKVLAGYKDWQIQQYGDTSIPNKLVKNTAGLNDNEWEITSGVHGDIDYLYVLNCKARTLRCYRRYSGEGFDVSLKSLLNRERLVEIPEWEEGSKTMYE